MRHAVLQEELIMNFPVNLKYTKTHEWVKDMGNGLFEIGISDYAQKELGDIVYVNLPQTGDKFEAGVSFADLESVKAVTDVLSPVNGIVVEVNEAVVSGPDIINKAPYEAWFIRIEGSLVEALLSAEEYEKSLV
jgi:glycine cleavage system H protein